MTPPTFALSPAPAPHDHTRLLARIRAAYGRAVATPLGDTDSMWLHGELFDMRREIHDALIAADADGIAAMLQAPGRTNLQYGFEDLNRTFLAERLGTLDTAHFAALEFLGLLQLGRATGLYRVTHHDQAEPPPPALDEILARLDEFFGFRIEIPNPFPDEAGLATDRGVLSYRVPPALYQAWRISQLVGGRSSPRVLEIGGGLGRTAYYARQFGIRDYTIVDIPMTLVAQANFLGRTLGEDALHLYGEDRYAPEAVKLLPPSAFLESTSRYDLVLNVDSMTEMARDTAQAYCHAIHARADTFLSINHEGLGFTVAELMPGGMFQRSLYWMRPGYVEELGGARPAWSPGREIGRRAQRMAARAKARAMRFGRQGPGAFDAA